MAFTVVFICIIAQRVFNLGGDTRKYTGFVRYYAWMQKYFARIAPRSGLLGVLLMVLPAFVALILVFSLVYHLAGAIAYYALSLLVVWYCLDARYLSQARTAPFKSGQLLSVYYQHVFAVIFWYFIFGLAGVVLYFILSELRELLEKRSDASGVDQALLAATIRVEGVMDWVPLRLMGLTYAVIGHFTPTFKLWLHGLMAGFTRTREQVAECGVVALGIEQEGEMTEARSMQIEQFVNRALCVWLLVMGLFTAGAWFG